MTHEFDRNYWERRWQATPGDDYTKISSRPPNPYLIQRTAHLAPGSALEAGCGDGAEAVWLASNGWHVLAADIAPSALGRTAHRAQAAGVANRIRLAEADLSQWQPGERFDLVTSHYAHPAMPQLDFYVRIADWVEPGGTLLLVGHLHVHGVTGHDHHPPESASVTAAAIIDRLGTNSWRIEAAEELERVITSPQGEDMTLHDVVVHAVRRS
jgi:SAM-dependent methyltransferase